jgi:GNAT superfamily N-acetyltransferase
MIQKILNSEIRITPLSTSNWSHFEKLMGERGGCGGCWCMTFRLATKDYKQNKFEGNKKLMKNIVERGLPTGLIATIENEPVGWIALAPREHYLKIENSRSLKRIDQKPVWSITCFYTEKKCRRKGLSSMMIRGAIDFAKKHKIKVLEAYPAIPYSGKVSAPFLWTGILSAFLGNGFKIVQKYGVSKAMVRLEL